MSKIERLQEWAKSRLRARPQNAPASVFILAQGNGQFVVQLVTGDRGRLDFSVSPETLAQFIEEARIAQYLLLSSEGCVHCPKPDQTDDGMTPRPAA
jgi:hypothetical protein